MTCVIDVCTPFVPGMCPLSSSRFLTGTGTVDGPQTTLTSLSVGNVMTGATVALRCLGARCPFETKRTTKVRNRVVNALAMLGKKPAKRRFRAGQSLELRITAPGYLGKVIRYKIRRGKQPKVTKLCLPLGATKPQPARPPTGRPFNSPAPSLAALFARTPNPG